MSLVSRIKDLATSRKITISELERKLDFGNGTIGRWDTRKPSIEKVTQVADYFEVSVDYLLEKTDNPGTTQAINSTDLDKILDNAKSFDGKPMTENDREAIRAFIQGRFSK